MEETVNVRDELATKLYGLINGLDELEAGSDEHSKAVNDIDKLYRLALDNDKYYQGIEEAAEKKEADDKNTRNQLILSYGKIGMEAIMFLLSIGVSARFLSEGFKFEETGAFRSTAFRMMIPKILPNFMKKG